MAWSLVAPRGARTTLSEAAATTRGRLEPAPGWRVCQPKNRLRRGARRRGGPSCRPAPATRPLGLERARLPALWVSAPMAARRRHYSARRGWDRRGPGDEIRSALRPRNLTQNTDLNKLDDFVATRTGSRLAAFLGGEFPSNERLIRRTPSASRQGRSREFRELLTAPCVGTK